MTSFLLQRAGIPTPPTWAIESPGGGAGASSGAEARPGPAAGAEAAVRIPGPRPAADRRAGGDLPPAEEVAGVYYLQQFVARRDGGLARLAGVRHRRPRRRRHDPPRRALAHQRGPGRALRSACPPRARWRPGHGRRRRRGRRTMPAWTSSGTRTGRYLVLEVNSMPAWRALQRRHAASTSPRSWLADVLWRSSRPRAATVLPLRQASPDGR